MEMCERCHEPTTQGEHGLWKCPLLSMRRRSAAVWQDSIEGGIEITNGICNADGTPRRYYSKTEMREAMRAKGIVPYHDVFTEGGNQTLADARSHSEWLKSSESQKLRAERVEMRRAGRPDLARQQQRPR
jgi:hypothetical protein